MYRLLSLSVPSLGGNKMAVKKKKNLVVKAPAGGTIDLDETEREMEALIGEYKHLLPGGIIKYSSCSFICMKQFRFN